MKVWYENVIGEIESYGKIYSDISHDELKQALEGMEDELTAVYEKYENDLEEYEELLQLWGKSYGRTVLHLAAHMNYKKYLAFRLYYEASQKDYKKKDDFGFTPADYAEQEGHMEIVALLKEFKERKVKRKLV